MGVAPGPGPEENSRTTSHARKHHTNTEHDFPGVGFHRRLFPPTSDQRSGELFVNYLVPVVTDIGAWSTKKRRP